MAMTDRPPPRRPDTPPPTRGEVGSQRPRRPAAAGAATGPPKTSFAAAAVVLAFTLCSYWLGARAEIGMANTGREVDFNTLGYLAGCFVSIWMLYLFLRADGQARSTLRYNDWPGIGARVLMGWMTLCSWVGGALHLWFWAQDLTRP
ncbi:MAG: hypothetical protein OXB99_13690 [Acidimicrobiaceae bacterium]|nr:hypothetical protein [Acidimicrobiaceae bacterium]